MRKTEIERPYEAANELSSERQAVLEQEAARNGMPSLDYARHLLEKSLPQPFTAKQEAALELLCSLREEGDVQEQREIFDVFEQGLNTHHTSSRLRVRWLMFTMPGSYDGDNWNSATLPDVSAQELRAEILKDCALLDQPGLAQNPEYKTQVVKAMADTLVQSHLRALMQCMELQRRATGRQMACKFAFLMLLIFVGIAVYQVWK